MDATMEAVTLTERAARRIGEILKREPSGSMLRVSVEGGGCSGFQYKFDFDQTRAEDDLVLARDGVVRLRDQLFGIDRPLPAWSGAAALFSHELSYSAATAGRDGSATASSCGSSRRR